MIELTLKDGQKVYLRPDQVLQIVTPYDWRFGTTVVTPSGRFEVVETPDNIRWQLDRVEES